MLKRTKGCILITLLVITGLAGTIYNPSLSKKERKFVADYMKETKSAVIKSTSGLSESQLNFKQAADRWSIKDCIYHLALSEKNLWQMLETALKSPSNPEKRAEIKMTDDQVIQIIENRSNKVKTSEAFEPINAPYKNLSEAMSDFKNTRGDHIKYLKNTTEDLRNHVIQMPFGYLDSYQLCLMISAHNNRHLQQVNEIKSDQNFPKN